MHYWITSDRKMYNKGRALLHFRLLYGIMLIFPIAGMREDLSNVANWDKECSLMFKV
jgi:hypothetical protein